LSNQGVASSLTSEIEIREREGKAAHREEAEVPTLEKVTGARRRRSPPVSRRGITREGREPESTEGKESLWLGLGLEAFFLKRDMGAPDSLQCLSGAHRTAHSSCPVNHRTAHRKRSVTPGFRRQTECEPCTCQDQLFTYTTVT
jgi:hypothetical protein